MNTTPIGITFSFIESFAKLSKNDLHKVSQAIKKMYTNAKGLDIKKLQADKNNLWRIKVGDNLRIIYSQWQKGYMLHYVDYRKDVYDWLQRHAIIFDESRLSIEVFPYRRQIINVSTEDSPVAPIRNLPSQYGSNIAERLSEHHLPPQVIDKLKMIDSEESLFSFIYDLSPSYQEMIFNAATETELVSAKKVTSRLIILNDDEELERALKYPLDHWRLFLHPIQQEIVAQDPLKKLVIVGGPGTGKTIVLVHRAVRLFKENKMVLFITKTRKLAKILIELINKLIPTHNIFVSYFPEGNEPPDYWVRGNELGKLKSNTASPYKLRLMLTADWKYNSEVSRIDHILFDEAQDLYNSLELNWIRELVKLNIGMTLSIDSNQTVYPPYPKEILNILDTRAVTKYPLTYCYRSTKEILKYARGISEHAKNIHKIILSHKTSVKPEMVDATVTRLYYEKHQISHSRPKGMKKSKALREFRKSKGSVKSFMQILLKVRFSTVSMVINYAAILSSFDTLIVARIARASFVILTPYHRSSFNCQ